MIKVQMTPEAFAAKAAELKAQQGIVLSSEKGTIEKHGVKASYAYNGEELQVTILSKPFLVTTSSCENQLLSWLAGS